jgi:hypothetical protein
MEHEDLSFAFIDDAGLLRVLNDYHRQTRAAARVDAHLGVIVGCGSLVEGLLTWRLLKCEDRARASKGAPKDGSGQVRFFPEWGLAHLIDVSAELGLIGKTARQASWALKDFRNFIHPFNVLRQSARPDQALAMSCLAALTEIGRSLRQHLSQ